jgi:hypothetical protein
MSNCNKCNVVLTEENRYTTTRRNQSGEIKPKINNKCKDCHNKYAREYAQKRRQQTKEAPKENVIPDTCSKCKTPIESSEQWHVPSNQCILCYRKYQREYQKIRRSKPSTVDVEKDRLANCFKCKIVLSTEKRYGTTNQLWIVITFYRNSGMKKAKKMLIKNIMKDMEKMIILKNT